MKKIVDKLGEECIENVEDVKLSKIKVKVNINAIFSHCTLLYFQYIFQLTLELVTVSFIFVST